jgi:esterase/lipase superfamily enzyme
MDRLSTTLVCLAATALAVLACGRPRPPAPPPPALLGATPDRPNTPPSITFSGNVPEGEVVYGTIVDLVATCTDREDGTLGAVRWTTDRGELLADGSTLRYMPEPGRYIVRATCTDQARAATTVAATGPFAVVDRWSASDSVPVTVTVPFATNRGGALQTRAPATSFDGSPGDSLVRGFLTVNVPARDFRVAGFAERTPFMHSVRGNFVSGDATRRWIRQIGAADSIGFASRLAEAFTHGEEDEVIVFVHGYRTSFEGSAIRAARLAAELQFAGATILFAWPSDALLASYRSDQRDARDAGRHLAQLLLELRASSHPRRISIVAHSMGAEVLASAMSVLETGARKAGQSPLERLALRDVVFVSPDLAASEFLKHVLPVLHERAQRVTVYASTADIALWSSWGSNFERRLGLGGRFATVAQGIETIEVPYSEADAIGHNPFEAEPFRDDLHRLLVEGRGAASRALEVVPREDGLTMWRLR